MGGRDFQAVLRFVRAVEGMEDPAAFPRCVLSELTRLLPADIASYNEADYRRQRNLAILLPADACSDAQLRIFGRLVRQHPVIAHVARTADRRPLKISDFLSQRQFHRLEVYQDFYRQAGVEYQLSVTLPTTPRSTVLGIALNRGRRDFGEDERQLLAVVRPHLVAAYRNLEARIKAWELLAALEHGPEGRRVGAILMGHNGRCALATPNAERWLSEYLGGPVREGSRLPAELDAWLRHQQAFLNGETGMESPAPLTLDRSGRRLLVRFLPRGETGRYDVLLLQESHWGGAIADRLTPREFEVLALLSEGKTNRQIARTCVISPRTVQKHIEHIFQKLDVPTRAAAARRFTREQHLDAHRLR